MKKTPLSKGSKTMKKSGFKTKPVTARKKASQSTTAPQKRRRKSNLKKQKEKLWKLCREIQIKRFGRICYTCGAKDLQGSNCHLGHFIPSSVCSAEMRYSLDNLRIQCYHDNIKYKSFRALASV